MEEQLPYRRLTQRLADWTARYINHRLSRKFFDPSTGLHTFVAGSSTEVPLPLLFAEGPPDVDEMRFFEDVVALPADAGLLENNSPPFVIGPTVIHYQTGKRIHLHPGYVRIVELDIVEWLVRKEVVENVSYERTNRHGPANQLEASTERFDSRPEFHVISELNKLVKLDLDFVFSIRCPHWPTQADDFRNRTRTSGWPTDDLVTDIVKEGCHLVNINYLVSHETSLACAKPKPKVDEWRFSFSVAETRLICNWTPCQVYVYHLLRMIIKHENSTSGNRLGVCSYHLKTLMLWACERLPADKWKWSQIATYCIVLLTELAQNYLSRQLCHYFIPENNLFDAVKVGSNDSKDLIDQLLSKYSDESSVYQLISSKETLLEFDNGFSSKSMLPTETRCALLDKFSTSKTLDRAVKLYLISGMAGWFMWSRWFPDDQIDTSFVLPLFRLLSRAVSSNRRARLMKEYSKFHLQFTITAFENLCRSSLNENDSQFVLADSFRLMNDVIRIVARAYLANAYFVSGQWHEAMERASDIVTCSAELDQSTPDIFHYNTSGLFPVQIPAVDVCIFDRTLQSLFALSLLVFESTRTQSHQIPVDVAVLKFCPPAFAYYLIASIAIIQCRQHPADPRCRERAKCTVDWLRQHVEHCSLLLRGNNFCALLYAVVNSRLRTLMTSVGLSMTSSPKIDCALLNYVRNRNYVLMLLRTFGRPVVDYLTGRFDIYSHLYDDRRFKMFVAEFLYLCYAVKLNNSDSSLAYHYLCLVLQKPVRT